MRNYAGVCAGYLGSTGEGSPPRGAEEGSKAFPDAGMLRPDGRRRNKTGSAKWWKVRMCMESGSCEILGACGVEYGCYKGFQIPAGECGTPRLAK